MAVPERDGLQPETMTLMENSALGVFFFFFPDQVDENQLGFFSFPIPSGLTYELQAKSTGEQLSYKRGFPDTV